jgi:hypothetical protein
MFEKDLAKLADKIKNDDRYAQAVYHSLCNVDWINFKKAPKNWQKALNDQEDAWEKKNNVWWRQLIRIPIDKMRSVIVKLGIKRVKREGITYLEFRPVFGKLNNLLIKWSYAFRIIPPKSPDWIYRCSWRYAGGMVADIRNKGEDYMDFYCSGREGLVNDEFADDMYNMGWIFVSLE